MTGHQHGNLHPSCPEPACVDRRNRYYKRWRYDRFHGDTRTTTTTRARLHVATMIGAGWSARAIAGAAGVAPQTVTRVLDPDSTSIHKTTAAKILAVDPFTVASTPSRQTSEPFVPRVGTVRRLQALLYMGWTTRHLHEVYGIHPATLYQQGRWVTRTTHDKVAAAYRELSHRPGPSHRTRSRARAKGYAGPADWDDIDHDLEPEVEDAS